MKVDLDADDVMRRVDALEHYYAYTRAIQREGAGYKELADKLRRGESKSPRQR